MLEHPLIAALAPLLALAVALGALLARRRRVQAATRWSPVLGERARRGAREAPLLLALAALAALVAVAGPRWGRRSVLVSTRARDIVLAIDVSRSMLAEDQAPSRLAHALREARRLTYDLAGDRLGLVAFTASGFPLVPLTTDDGGVRLLLDVLDPDIASEGGTSLLEAMRAARDVLEAAPGGGGRAIVLFTDGEGHDTLPPAVEMARALGRDGVQLVVVAAGRPDGAPIPMRDEHGVMRGRQRDGEGNEIRTRRDDAALQAIARAADGVLIPADVPDQAGAVRGSLERLARADASAGRAADLVPRGWIAALAAALLLLGQALVRRGAALVVLAGLLLGGTAATAQRPSPGSRALGAGRASEAVTRFRDEAAREGTDTAWYDAGSAALKVGEHAAAAEALARAARSLDPGLRFRATYNAGVALLMAARADTGARREQLLDQAAERFRAALLLRPSSNDAKWNLELATRPPPPPQDGGGATRPPPSQAPKQGQGQASAAEGPSLSRAQAEQVLHSVEDEERGTLARLKGKGRGRLGARQDW